jgi:hypothetical protein
MQSLFPTLLHDLAHRVGISGMRNAVHDHVADRALARLWLTARLEIDIQRQTVDLRVALRVGID